MSAKLIYGYCCLCGVYCFSIIAVGQFYTDIDQTNGSRMRFVSSLYLNEIYSGTESDDTKMFIYLCRRNV